MIALVDYGLGNIQAFANIYRRLGLDVRSVQRPEDLRLARAIILPGVGSFDWAMTRLNESGMRDTLDELVGAGGVKVLGVCVGMQMMAMRSEEGTMAGLGWLNAEVIRFTGEDPESPVRLPHMGWNDVEPSIDGGLFRGMESPRFYFLHSYYVSPADASVVAASASYGIRFAASVQSGNVYGTQFHPEKSHRWGVELLKNFAEL